VKADPRLSPSNFSTSTPSNFGTTLILAAMTEPFRPTVCGGGSSTFSMPSQVSSSWGFSWDQGTIQLLEEFTLQGQSFFQASGDSGAYDTKMACAAPTGDIRGAGASNGTPAPTTLVGGTVLNMEGAGLSYLNESGWGGSGGGILPTLGIPSYQAGLAVGIGGISGTNRNAPDVAMDAVNAFIVFSDPAPGTLGTFFGTSASAPLSAGFMAVVNEANANANEPLVGFANPLFYRLAAEAVNEFGTPDVMTLLKQQLLVVVG